MKGGDVMWGYGVGGPHTFADSPLSIKTVSLDGETRGKLKGKCPPARQSRDSRNYLFGIAAWLHCS